MTSPPRALLALLAAIGACGRGEGDAGPAPRGARGAEEGLSLALPGGARALARYSYTSRPEVPWLGGLSPARLPFGELGLTPSTLVYQRFDADLEVEPPTESAPGRFGRGIRLRPRSRLRLPFPEGFSAPRAWTIELWLRPEAIVPGALLELPGLLALRLAASGRLEVELTGGARVASRSPLRAGEWQHVGVVLDLQDLFALRVVVDGEPAGKPLEPGLSAAEPEELVLGSPSDASEAGNEALPCTLDELRVQGRAANTSELEEHARASPRPLERLRLIGPDGRQEEHELWTAPLRDARVDTPEEWAAGELEHARADASGLRPVAGHWRRIEAPDPPLARTTHPTVYLGEHQVFLFGGETRDSHLVPMRNTADTWLFDTRRETWTRLATSIAPSPRCHQAAAYSPDHDLVLLAGGFRNDGPEIERLLDTWVFHAGERRWEERRPGGVRPGKLSDSGVVYHAGERLFVLFSRGRTLTYDPAGDRWEQLPAPEVVDERGAPAEYQPGGSVIATYDPRSRSIVLFGGQAGPAEEARFLDDCALFDLASNRMTLLAPPERPSPRVRAAAAWDVRRERLVLFGGVLDEHSERKRDLWSFDPATRRWTGHESANTPSARGGYYGMAYDPELERFFLLCGRHAQQRFLEEAWTLSLDEQAEGRARYAFDRAAFPGQSVWFAEVEAPAAGAPDAVSFRFRGGQDGLEWGPWQAACPPAARFVEVEVRMAPGNTRVQAMGFRAP